MRQSQIAAATKCAARCAFAFARSNVIEAYASTGGPGKSPLPPLCFNTLAQLNRCGRRSRGYACCMGAQPLIHRCDLYRLSLVRRQDAAEGHAN